MCSCLPGYVSPSLSLYLPSLSVCVRVICSTVVCSLCKTWAHTPCCRRGSTSSSTSCRTIFAFVTNFKWISLLSLPFPALPLSFTYFLRFCTRNSLRLRLRFVTLWPGIIWLWLWPWLHPHALDKYLLDLYLYCLFCGANCLTLSLFLYLLPPLHSFLSLFAASLLVLFFVNSFVLGLNKLLCHVCQILCHACSATLKCASAACHMPHATAAAAATVQQQLRIVAIIIMDGSLAATALFVNLKRPSKYDSFKFSSVLLHAAYLKR